MLGFLPFCVVAQSNNTSPAQPAIDKITTEVTVTGTRTATELDRSPVATSLVTRKELETRNVIQIDQALNLLEGVNAARTKGPSDTDFGVGIRGFAGRGSGQARTLILLDGQPLNNSYIGTVNWALLPVSEFERVEVARGPFSSLYGGNAMGGVINLITRPISRRSVEIFGQYGGYDTTNYSIHAADQFFGRLGLSFGYQRYQTGGYPDQEVLQTAAAGSGGTAITGLRTWLNPAGATVYQVGMRGNGWFNQEAFRGRAEYTFGSKTFASVQVFHQTRGQAFDAYRSFARTAAGTVLDSGLVNFTTGGITRRLTLAPLNFIGTPAGAENNTYQSQLLTSFNSQWNLRLMAGVNDVPADWYVTPGANSTLTGGPGSLATTSGRSYYGNAQLGWAPNRRHQWIGGAETRQDNAQVDTNSAASYLLRAPGPLQNFAGGSSVNQAVYIQDQIAVTERLQVVVGGRYDYWRTYDGRNQVSPALPARSYTQRSSNAFTGKIAASWQGGRGFTFRASAGNAFRNPTVYELYRDLLLSSGNLLANPDAKPERLFSYDAGVGKKFGSAAGIDVSFYENRISDLLYRTTDFATDPTGLTRRLTNAGLGRTRGVEIAAKQRLFSWLQAKTSYTYANAVITKNPALPATVGRHIPYVPSHMMSFLLLADYHRWFGSVSGRYQSSMFSTDTNTDVVRGVPGSYSPYFVGDISAGCRLTRHFTVTANVYNLLDRRYYLYNISPGRQAFIGLRIQL